MQYRIRREGEPENGQQPAATESWERNTLREALLETYKEQRRNRIWRNIWRVIWLLVFLSLIVGLRGGASSNAPSGDHTAVIRLSGTISNEYQDQVATLRDSLQAAYSNSSVKGIIIRANSPGGSPVISNIAYEEIRRLKKEHPDTPLYVVAEDVCASGCYYIAAAADKIYADPSSVVGSIGVIGGGFDFTGLMDTLGIKRRLKTAGSNKGMGDPFSPETPEQAKIWEQMLTDIHQEFIKAVKLGRGNRLKEKEYPDMFSGRIYTGSEAKAAGLIDDFGNVYSISRDVIGAPELVDYTEEDPLGMLLGRRIGMAAEEKAQSIINRLW